MPRPRRPRPTARGFTILEAVIAMTIMMIGLVGTLSTLALGSNSNRAARGQTLATNAAVELLSALQQLPPGDPALTANVASAAVPPAGAFGPVLSSTGSLMVAAAHTWSDAAPIPGVRTDAQLALSPEGMLRMQRRWIVWSYTPPGMPAGMTLVRLISVSIVYEDPATREIVVYGQRPDLGALLVSNLVSG